MAKILLIDNYDSFTYNLLHLFAALPNTDVDVVKNDDNFLAHLKSDKYDGVIIGPGPGDPTDEHFFGQNMELIRKYGAEGLPILGVCLGFQGIAAFYGAKLKQAKEPRHGKTSKLKIIEPDELFQGISDGTEVMRYHSLMIDCDADIPNELIFTAEVDPSADTVAVNGMEIMAFRHKSLPIYGVQFHPESFATELGERLAANFIALIKNKRAIGKRGE